MTLTTRVSRFFLVALGVMLIGYSVLLFSLARYSLNREFDQQLRGALNTLVAAVEVESDDVKWEPTDHTVTLGSDRDIDDVRWAVVNQDGAVIDQSANLLPTPEGREILDYARAGQTSPLPLVERDGWRFLRFRLAAPSPKPVSERDEREHAALVITVARSTAALGRTLNGLAALVTALSCGTWILAAIVGRWFARRALAPVGAMAASARTIGPENPAERLPVTGTDDELGDLGRAFNELLDQLFQACRRQQRFAGDAAHQLRTPLTVLQGQIEVSLRRPRSPEKYVETLQLLNAQVIELRQIVESLLFLARAENDSDPPCLTPVELVSWISDYLPKWRTHARMVDLRFTPGPPVTAAASEPLLVQLLDNLVENALKYSAPGSPVTLTVARVEDEVALTVADEGVGIAEEEVAAVFEPFYRSPAARRSGIAGTGLGLALAARIARTLQGRLVCVSSAGMGSQFTLHLPLIR